MKKKAIEITKGKLIAYLIANAIVIIGAILSGVWWLSGISKQIELINKQQDNFMQFIMKGF
jgi:hypothetical protein